MKFLLVGINAKYIHSNPAIYSLKAYACMRDKRLESQIDIAEYTINLQLEEILSDLYDRKPDIIGFSCYIWNITYVHRLLAEVPKILPDAKIFLGGPEVTYDACELLLKENAITGIMLGEGEETFLDLMEYYNRQDRQIQYKKDENNKAICPDKEKEGLEKIMGMAYLKDGEVIFTEPRPLTNLSEVPFLYYNLNEFKNKIIYYESSRGCPFRCSYCLSSIDKKVRLRDTEVVKKELAFFLENRVAQVKFVDRTFNCNREHALTIWRYIKENDNGITNFHFEVEADILSEEELTLLSELRPGAVQLEIGVQSTHEKTIREIDRVMNVERLTNIVKRIHDGRNIHVHLDLIAGLPFEDFETFRNSFNDVYFMQPEQLQLGFLKVLKGSKMYEKRKEYGLVYTDEPPYEVLYTDWISYEQIRVLKRVEEMVELYYNSNQFTVTLPLLERYFDTPFDLYLELSKYYVEKGYFIKSPARSQRYTILLDFIREIVCKEIKHEGIKTKEVEAEQIECLEVKANKGKKAEQKGEVSKIAESCDIGLFREALTVDMYLRENCKSRPAFADEIEFRQKDDYETWKEKTRRSIHLFYQKEAETHRLLQSSAYRLCDAKNLSRMTHVEPVHFDFVTGKKLEQEKYLLFDYQVRDPLTYDAKVMEISMEQE